MRLLLALLLLSSCSALRTGWVKVDFITGKPTDLMVCSFEPEVDSDGEIENTGKCADWNDVNEGLGAMGNQYKLKQLYNTQSK